MTSKTFRLNDDGSLTPIQRPNHDAPLTVTEQKTLWRTLDQMRETFYRLTAAYEREIERETGAVCALTITPIDSVFVDAADKNDCEIAARFLATTTKIAWDGTCEQIHIDDGSTDWTAYLEIPPSFSQ